MLRGGEHDHDGESKCEIESWKQGESDGDIKIEIKVGLKVRYISQYINKNKVECDGRNHGWNEAHRVQIMGIVRLYEGEIVNENQNEKQVKVRVKTM